MHRPNNNIDLVRIFLHQIQVSVFGLRSMLLEVNIYLCFFIDFLEELKEVVFSRIVAWLDLVCFNEGMFKNVKQIFANCLLAVSMVGTFRNTHTFFTLLLSTSSLLLTIELRLEPPYHHCRCVRHAQSCERDQGLPRQEGVTPL